MGTRTENLYFDTVPVKGKLTVSTRNSKLDPRSFRFLEARVSRLEFQVSSFELRTSSFEFRASSFQLRVSEFRVSSFETLKESFDKTIYLSNTEQ